MAISSGQLTVGTTATIIDGTFNSNFRLVIQNMDNTDAAYIRGSSATIPNGLQLLKQETLQLEMNPLESVYAVSDKAGHLVSYLKQV